MASQRLLNVLIYLGLAEDPARGRARHTDEPDGWVCATCGALVAEGWQARHPGWHTGEAGH